MRAGQLVVANRDRLTRPEVDFLRARRDVVVLAVRLRDAAGLEAEDLDDAVDFYEGDAKELTCVSDHDLRLLVADFLKLRRVYLASN
jgi:hypothetical protein